MTYRLPAYLITIVFVSRGDANGNYAEVNLGSVCNILREAPDANDADMIGNMTVRFLRTLLFSLYQLKHTPFLNR